MRRVRGEFRAAFSRASDSGVLETAECGKEGVSSIRVSRDSVKPAGLVDVRACVQAGERVLVRVCVVE